METLAELQAQLVVVQNAITALIQGKRLTQLRVGSGDFQRHYQYSEINLDMLRAERNSIQTKISLLTATTVEPTYRESAPIGVQWSKL